MAFIEIKHWRNDSLYVVDITTKGVDKLLEKIVEQSHNDTTKQVAMDLPNTPSKEEFKKILEEADKACEEGEQFDPVYVGENIYSGYNLICRIPDFFESGIFKAGDELWCGGKSHNYGYGEPVIVLWADNSRDGNFLVRDSNGYEHLASYNDKWYKVAPANFVHESYDLYDKYYHKGNWNKAIDEIIRLKRKCGELN